MRKAGKKMHVILCADDRNGMMFHRRRQSRDRAVLEDIEKLRAGKTLLMYKYSDKMFSEYGYSDHETFESSEAALTAAGEDDFCFLEDISPAAHRGRIGSIVIYRWNRHYPSDLRIEGDLLDGWAAVERMDFEGNSHEKITREIFERQCGRRTG